MTFLKKENLSLWKGKKNSMVAKEQIFPIGIGTWKIDYENFEKDIDSLLYSIQNGQNYLSLYMLYNDGKVVREMRKLLEKVDRSKLFINVNLEPTVTSISDIEKQLNQYLEILNIEYVDSLELHRPDYSTLPLVDVYKEIARLVSVGKVRHIGISNASLEQLQEVNSVVPIDFFEGVYNLECKLYEDNRVLEYCRQNHIYFMAYQALRRNRTAKRNYKELVELSEKYGKTQNQILLNWIVKEKGIFPIIKSTNMERIKENLNALNFNMESEDYEKLNEFRSKEFDDVAIDFLGKGGITIDQLANQFE